MVTQSTYDELKYKYGTVASWTLWYPAEDTKKSLSKI